MRPTRRGNVTLLLAVSLVVVLGFVAMSVDWGAVAVARWQAQAAADAAALAATTEMGDTTAATTVARAYASRVTFNNRPVSIADDAVVFGSWDGTTFTETEVDPNVVRVTATTDVDLTLTRLFGIDSVRVAAVAGAGPSIARKRAPDVVLALDVTGSMSTSEIAQERVAAQAFVDCVANNSTGDSKIGIVLFTGVDTTLVGMTEVGSGYTTLANAIRRIRGCDSSGMPACSGTNQAAGQGAALTMLADADTPDDVGQAVILMSDGEPNADSICVSSNYNAFGWRPDLQSLCSALGSRTTCTGSGRNRRCTTTQNQPTLTNYRNWSDAYVTESESLGVDVYTVYYGSEAAGITYLEDHVAAGAGFSLDTPDAAGMTDAFQDICVAYASQSAGMAF